MVDLTPAVLLALSAAALVGAGIAFLLMRRVCTARLRDARARTERALQARARANDLLAQARRQAEMLQKELALARRERPPATPQPPAPPPAAEAEDERPELPPHGFAPTMPFKP